MQTLMLALLCVLLGTAVADKCDAVSPITNFNTAEYLGIWYQIAVNRQFYEQFEAKYPLCTYANYTLNQGGYVNVMNVGFNSTGAPNIAVGKATQPDATVGRLEVSFYGSPPAPYNVIKMLYDNNGKYRVALVWSCAFGGLVEDLWILARTKTIAKDDYDTLISYATAAGIDVEKLQMQMTNQTDCPVLPATSDIVKARSGGMHERSSCPITPALTGFNTTEYLGVWYQIAVDFIQFDTTQRKYPLCVVANYTLNPAGYVDVVNKGYNSAGQADVATAKATQPDATVAHLEVSFNGGRPAPYNVVKMLYDNNGKYRVAVVYDCFSLEGTDLQAFFLIARTRTISAAEQAEVFSWAGSVGINVNSLRLHYTDQSMC